LARADGSAAVPLTPITTFAGGTGIQPFWLQLPESPRLRPHEGEVAAILRIPIADLRREGIYQPIPHPFREGAQTMAYVWRGEIIWGATARIIDEFLQKLDNA